MTEGASPKPRLFVIAAPSGAGKTTLVKALTDRNPELCFSISYTTRPKRRTETDGKDYLFVTPREFERLRLTGELLESAEVFDHLYGTSRSAVQKELAAGHPVLLEIDWQGARQVRRAVPDSVSIFILPPSLEELVRRLTTRGTDTPEVIARRFRDARSDMSHWQEFDHVVINAELSASVAQLEAILAGEGNATATRNPAVRRAVRAIVDGPKPSL